jgi:PAS domain S-box-containing protein
MRELAQLVRSSEAWLLARVKSCAEAQGSLLPAPALRSSCEASLAAVSEVLLKAIAKGAPGAGAERGTAPSPLAAFAKETARLHKARRARLGPLLACLSCHRQGFADLVAQSSLADVPRQQATSFLSSFFDRLVAALAEQWCAEVGGAAAPRQARPRQDAETALERPTSELLAQLREASALNCLGKLLSQEAESEAALLGAVAEFIPKCWDALSSMFAVIRLDGLEYLSAGASRLDSGQPLTEPLTILGQQRGAIQLSNLRDAGHFQPADAQMLSAIARQLEQVLETRRSLALLRQSERQFREFFDSAADAIFVHDEAGCILDANTNAGIWLGQSKEGLARANLLESFAATEREMISARFKNAFRGTPELFETTLIRRDGFAVPVEFLCQAQDFQGKMTLITSGRNIAGRLRAQQEITRRLKTEELVSTISGRLINSGETGMTLAIEESLSDLCRFLDIRRAAVYLYDFKKRAFLLTHRQRVLENFLPRSLRRLGPGKAPWFTERVLAGETVFIRDVAHMPPSGRKEKALLAQIGIASLIALPMKAKDKLLGVFIVGSDTSLDPKLLAGTRVLEQVALLFSNALERQRTGAALRRSEGLAHAILNALPANLCVLDRRGQLTMVNRSWAATGPESTPLGGEGARLGLGDNYLDACRAATDNVHAAAVLEGLLAVLARKAPAFRAEYPGTVNGLRHWFLLQAVPLAKGMAGAVVSHRDITTRMQAMTKLTQSEERFRIIVETAQEAIIMLDGKADIIYANPRAGTLFGYGIAELEGQPIESLLDPEDKPQLEQKLKRRRQGHSDQYELRFRHKNGRRIWTMLNASPLRGPDGSVIGSIGMITDISDRVRTEQRLRRNEARYRSLVESMHEGLVMARQGGIVTYVNNRFCVMLGMKKAEITGRRLSEFVDEGSKKRLTQMLSDRQQAAGESHARQEEILWKHVSGRHIYSLVSPSTYADEEGKTADFFAVVTDTTDRKSLESQVLHSQKLEAIGQLAAGIAHEINTPAQYVGNNTQFIKGAFADMLAVIQAAGALVDSAKAACPGMKDIEALERIMRERDVEYLTTEVPSAINQTLEGVERISTIVRSVKQFAHPGEAIMAPSDLNEAMRSTATVSRNEWKYVAELDLDLDPALPLVVCMIGEINQVVLNLIINAAHAIADAKKAEPGREGRITLATRFAPPWAEIRVSDTGTGIPQAVQAKIFDPFFTTKEVGRGTGQGLTISRSIVVEKHKGQLFFETRQGEGTTFVVRLPLAQPDS